MEFKEILKKIEETKAVAEMQPESNPRKYTVQLGKIRRAQEDLSTLFKNYKSLVSQKAVFILPEGPGADKFTEIASEGLYVINPDDMFIKVVDKLNPVLYSNQKLTVDTMNTVMNYFREVAEEAEIISYPDVDFKSKYIVPLNKREDLEAVLRDIVVEQIGAEMIGYYTVHSVSKMAVEEKFTGKVVPILIKSDDEQLKQKLSTALQSITKNVFKVETKEDITEKDVEAQLKKIKKLVV